MNIIFYPQRRDDELVIEKINDMKIVINGKEADFTDLQDTFEWVSEDEEMNFNQSIFYGIPNMPSVVKREGQITITIICPIDAMTSSTITEEEWRDGLLEENVPNGIVELPF